jgi:hypothetical protein
MSRQLSPAMAIAMLVILLTGSAGISWINPATNASLITLAADIISPYANDTAHYDKDNIREMVNKFTSKTSPYYNERFAQIVWRMDTSVDHYIFRYDPKRQIGEVAFDGKNVYILITDLGPIFGTQNGAEGCLFEEVKHVEQFFDGETFFQKDRDQWKSVSNLQIEIDAKMFVAAQLKYDSVHSVIFNNVQYNNVPTVLGYLNKLITNAERGSFLKYGAKLLCKRPGGAVDIFTYEATYPNHDPVKIKYWLKEKTKNDTVFGYPPKNAMGDSIVD